MIDDIYHENVRYLGNLLGEVIKEQEGQIFFELVENAFKQRTNKKTKLKVLAPETNS